MRIDITKQKKAFVNYQKLTNIIGFSGIGISVIVGIVGVYRLSFVLVIISVVLLLISVFFIMIIKSVLLFQQDKVLDIEKLKEMGLTIIPCPNCNKENVKEDIYCIYCGEKLEV